MFVAAALSAVMAKFVFYYGWSWMESFLFGSIVSATDPVAVVAILSGLGKLGATVKNCLSNWLLIKLQKSIALIETEIELLGQYKYSMCMYFVKFHNADCFREYMLSKCFEIILLGPKNYWQFTSFLCIFKYFWLKSKINTGTSNLTQLI